MKLIKNIISYFWSIVTILISITTVNATNQLITLESEIESDNDEKIYSVATIDDDFVDNHILVVMDRNVK